MAVPVQTTPYSSQLTAVDVEIGPFDLASDGDVVWTGDPTFFVVNTLPPKFAFDGVLTLSGAPSVDMVYALSIQAGNADGLSDSVELLWLVLGTGTRVLYGISTEWQFIAPAGFEAVLYIRRATRTGAQTTWNAGTMNVNNIGDDGTASFYDSSFLNKQIIIGATSALYLRATEPGWEVIIDNS